MQANTFSTSLLPRRNWLAHSIGALLIASTLAFAPHADARVFVSVNIAPPLLPVYLQPPIPGPGYIWVPGYWAWDDYYGDYYWVPGCWVRPPYAGALWTPSYWAWDDGAYVYYPGYWGLTVGYYGGIDYGFGYGGIGYYGGYWNNSVFYYNKTVNNITINNITNVYTGSPPAGAVVTTGRASFTGPNGVNHLATQAELANSRQVHTDPVAMQTRQQTLASRDASLRMSANHGMPPIAATSRAGSFMNAQRASTSAAMAAGSSRRDAAALGRSAQPSDGFVHHRNAVQQSNSSSALHERSGAAMERTPRTNDSRDAAIRSMQAMRANNAHAPREFFGSRPFVEHRQPTARVNEGTRFPSSAAPTGPERQIARNAGSREMPPMRSYEGPRPGGGMHERPAPRGVEQRQPAGDKPKDRDRHGGG